MYGQLLVWDIGATELDHLLKLESSVRDLAWSPDGTRLASASDHVHIWNAAAGDVLTTLKGHAGHVAAVRWSPDGTMLASRGVDRTVIVWGIPTNE
jgi:WD40 repeat protein